MMRRTVVALLGVLLFALDPASAQERPDFSGRWKPIEGGGPATVLTIVQDATTLEATLGDGPNAERARYSFSTATEQDVAHADVTVTSTATWKQNAVVITNTFKSKSRGLVLSVRDEVWSLDPNGHLVIETTTRRSNGPTASARSIYVKQ